MSPDPQDFDETMHILRYAAIAAATKRKLEPVPLKEYDVITGSEKIDSIDSFQDENLNLRQKLFELEVIRCLPMGRNSKRAVKLNQPTNLPFSFASIRSKSLPRPKRWRKRNRGETTVKQKSVKKSSKRWSR